jgi:hypothetical protein
MALLTMVVRVGVRPSITGQYVLLDRGTDLVNVAVVVFAADEGDRPSRRRLSSGVTNAPNLEVENRKTTVFAIRL